MSKCSGLKTLFGVITIIGALNWGFVGFFKMNLVEMIVEHKMAQKIIYDVIGVSALIYAFLASRCCCSCPNCACNNGGCNDGSCDNMNGAIIRRNSLNSGGEATGFATSPPSPSGKKAAKKTKKAATKKKK